MPPAEMGDGSQILLVFRPAIFAPEPINLVLRNLNCETLHRETMIDIGLQLGLIDPYPGIHVVRAKRYAI